MAGAEPVLVVGAGIGGLTVALALARKGVAVTILEQRTVLAEAGAGIQLSPNASRVLGDLGLGSALARRAVEPERVVIRSLKEANEIGTIALGPAMRARFGAPYLVVHRADLHAILLDQVRASSTVRLLVGRRVIGAETRDAEAVVSVETESGQKAMLRAPLAIGADGLWSAMRRALGDERQPRFQGYAAWRATLPREAAPPLLQTNETGLWLGAGAHAVHYPVAGGTLINLVVVAQDRAPVEGWSTLGQSDALLARLAGAAEPLRALMAAAGEWRLSSLFDLPTSRRWTRGRLTLLGDAAHPVLPFLAQGGALAIEDAAVLADRLAALPDRLGDALRAYERTRRPRAIRVQRAARRNGRIYHLPDPLAKARDLVMRSMGARGLTRRYDWLYGWKAAGADQAAETRAGPPQA